MKPEVILIKAFCTHSIWKENRELVPKNVHPAVKALFEVQDRLLTEVGRDISTEELKAYYEAVNGHEDNSGILSQLDEDEINPDLIETCIRAIKDRQTASRLAVECLNVVEGKRSIGDLAAYFSELGQDSESPAEEFTSLGLSGILKTMEDTPGLNWRLDCLNQSLGPLRRGDFGFLYARPETGKTTFLTSEVTNFAAQAVGPVLWFNNEQAGSAVGLRLNQSALNKTTEELLNDVEGNERQFHDITCSNILLHDSATIHKTTVEKLCKRLNPALIIFDQIDKLKGFSDDREDLRLGAIYIWARELAKQYCPVIGVCQASATGEDKKWLTLEDISNSKTSKAAEADWILGIGKVADHSCSHQRFLSIIKNKLVGSSYTKPNLRHAGFAVRIDEARGRYIDM